ncbi:MAG: hypothetical protein AVDCRST_MAG11-1522, partial [uncultured Gemmatimonadaceae bacterium]
CPAPPARTGLRVTRSSSTRRACARSAMLSVVPTAAAACGPAAREAPSAAPFPALARLPPAAPSAVGMSDALPGTLDSIVTAAIADRATRRTR